MKEAIGGATMLNTIIIFIVLLFTFIFGTVLYYKAYKVNTRIADSLEKYEGYNRLALNEINKKLSIMSYAKSKNHNFDTNDCETRHGVMAINDFTPEYMYCIYEIDIDDNYYKYGVLTYIDFKDPIFGVEFKIPIYSETERIYHFNEK